MEQLYVVHCCHINQMIILEHSVCVCVVDRETQGVKEEEGIILGTHKTTRVR